MLSVDQQTMEFVEIYQLYTKHNQITSDILARLYALLDRAYFITFGPFQTVVSDYLTAKCEHTPAIQTFNHTFSHFASLQNFPRAAGAAFRGSEKQFLTAVEIASQLNSSLENNIIFSIKKAFFQAAKSLSAAQISGFAEWGFSGEGKKFAKMQNFKDEIEQLKQFNSQEEADVNVRKIAFLEDQIKSIQDINMKSEGMRWTLKEIKAFYCSLKARICLCEGHMGRCKGGGVSGSQKDLFIAPSAVVQLNYAQLTQALAARGDIDMCMDLIINCDVSPSLLIQNLTKYIVELLACVVENAEIPKGYKMQFLTSYHSKYVHKLNIDFKCRKDLDQELTTALNALFDVLVFCKELNIDSGTSTSVVFSGNPFTEYVCSAFILSGRFQCKIKILHLLVNINKEYFVSGILQTGTTPCYELNICGEIYEIQQDIKDFLVQIEIISGIQQGIYQLQMPQQQSIKIQAQQKQLNAFKAPGAVSTGVKVGAGTFVQNKQGKLDLTDLTVQKAPTQKKSVAFMPFQ
eukprot:EST45648.1 hypothetical protein SS50377_14220 [Spironucleus salmonicida]